MQPHSIIGSEPRWRIATGWIAVVLNTATAALWAYWGSIEAFHEGWWHASLTSNLAWTFAYLVPATLFVALGLIGTRWPRAGAVIILAFTIWFWWWWNVPARLASGGGNTLVGLVMTGTAGLFAAMWWLGRPRPRSKAMLFTAAIPLLVGIAFGAEPAWRIAHRLDDGNTCEREIVGNGVRLTWAPDGPGFPGRAQNWREANNIADHLSQDGLTVVESPQHFWRLPTREELVRSMVRHGKNAGGTWDAASQRADYETLPDKESPLWNPHSEVIYWWSSDEADDKLAWSITYAGMLVPRSKEARMGTLGFRLVRR